MVKQCLRCDFGHSEYTLIHSCSSLLKVSFHSLIAKAYLSLYCHTDADRLHLNNHDFDRRLCGIVINYKKLLEEVVILVTKSILWSRVALHSWKFNILWLLRNLLRKASGSLYCHTTANRKHFSNYDFDWRMCGVVIYYENLLPCVI